MLVELELRHLKLVNSIARLGSLSKASIEIGLSQPSLTQQLAKLERYLGASLFIRTPTGMIPTDSGRALIQSTNYLVPLVADLSDRFRVRAARSAGVISGFIRMASMPGPFVAPVVAAISEIEPEWGMHLSAGGNIENLTEGISRGQVDIAILSEVSGVGFAPPVKIDGTRKIMIGRSEYVALASDKKQLGEGAVVSFSDLGEERWIFSSCTPAAVRAGFLKLSVCAGSSPRVVGEMDLLMAQELVRENYGLSVIDSGFAAPSGTRKIPVEGSPFKIVHFIVWRDGLLGEQFIGKIHEFSSAGAVGSEILS
ncbi:LysR family transcriptional regulator [Amycolatopsis sp. A1MSW2902]|uniref:LysR family transcriptional regulator n=1 Tax=Amycolatopsis sp. A1MSW2902 TaxID=687413 RepID=UPI00307DF579